MSKGAQLPAHLWSREPGAHWTSEHTVACGRVELMAQTGSLFQSAFASPAVTCSGVFSLPFSFWDQAQPEKDRLWLNHAGFFFMSSSKCVVSEV